MDPLTQGLLGAGLAQSCARRGAVKIAAACGFIGGMAADLDTFIRSPHDPLLYIEYHRHFTHALAFIPFGGLLVSLLLFAFLRKKAPFSTLYIFATLGYATHGFLDACTSYGTRLYWPFSDHRVSWNIISIIDPVFTLTLFVFVLLSLVRASPMLARVGLALALCYLLSGWLRHEKVKTFIHNVAAQRHHTIDSIILNPTIGNNILWRSVYRTNDTYFVDAVYAPPFGDPIMQEGKKVDAIHPHTVFPELGQNSLQRRDIERFSYFSQGYIYLHPDYDHVIADLRYGTLPYDDKSLWGIQIDPATPQTHVKFRNLRSITSKHYDEFWLMLNGQFR